VEDKILRRTDEDLKPRLHLYNPSTRWLSCIFTTYVSFGAVLQASCMGSGRST
jgi:hypothetical protein